MTKMQAKLNRNSSYPIITTQTGQKLTKESWETVDPEDDIEMMNLIENTDIVDIKETKKKDFKKEAKRSNKLNKGKIFKE